MKILCKKKKQTKKPKPKQTKNKANDNYITTLQMDLHMLNKDVKNLGQK